MKNKKYELLKDDAVASFGRTLYRIKAKTDFGNALAFICLSYGKR